MVERWGLDGRETIGASFEACFIDSGGHYIQRPQAPLEPPSCASHAQAIAPLPVSDTLPGCTQPVGLSGSTGLPAQSRVICCSIGVSAQSNHLSSKAQLVISLVAINVGFERVFGTSVSPSKLKPKQEMPSSCNAHVWRFPALTAATLDSDYGASD